jgi:hypothetical protein
MGEMRPEVLQGTQDLMVHVEEQQVEEDGRELIGGFTGNLCKRGRNCDSQMTK